MQVARFALRVPCLARQVPRFTNQPPIFSTQMHRTFANYNDVIAANKVYVEEFSKTEKGSLALPPARGFAILTCMDARLDPAKYAGLAEGDAHVIRNAGGRASDDAIRSLVISHKLLGTKEWFVVHHTNCGMELFDDQTMGNLLSESLETASLGADGAWTNTSKHECSNHGKFVKWHTFKDLEQSVIDDVQRIISHPLVSSSVTVHGFYYDCSSGKLIDVVKDQSKGKS